jgi:hypothetical protein
MLSRVLVYGLIRMPNALGDFAPLPLILPLLPSVALDLLLSEQSLAGGG